MPGKANPSRSDEPPEPPLRFDATITTTERAAAIETVTAMDLDRLPDLNGEVRVLLTLEEVGALVESGHEVHLRAALRVTPLDRSLILDDRSAQEWLEQQVEGIARQGGS